MHGGTVAARSDGVGRGSEFIVRIPAAQPSTRDVPSRPPGPSLCASAARRVLVVDDNKDAAELLGELLSAYGHAVTLAFDGPSALVAADTFEPDAVVLDIGLPVMDGYELAAKLRERWGQSVELIAVTGYGQENDKTRAAMAGFDRHLVKPVDGDELIAALTK